MDCCNPNIERLGGEIPASSGIGAAARQGVPANDFVRLEGEFLMGTTAPVRNWLDGEDPVLDCDDDGHERGVCRVRGGEGACD